MKIINRIKVLLMAVALPVGFMGCGDDDPIIDTGDTTPDFVLDQESLKVKIGAENKVTVAIKEGGGEYSAFSLDESMAKVELENGVVTVEGFANGQTSLIVSDKYSRYRRLPISVYTTDVLKLDESTIDLVAKLGTSGSFKANVVEGNDGYEAESDNPAVSVSVNEEGEISIVATSKIKDYTATLTISDCTGISAEIKVTVKATFEAFTDEELETIKSSNTRRYYYNGSSLFYYYYTPLNETLDDGRQRYGYKYYSSSWAYYDFAGGKEVGAKTNATFTYKNYYGETVLNPVKLEVIKNDGSDIWGIFSYIDEVEEKLHSGYFCDKI